MRFRGGFTLSEALEACGSLLADRPPVSNFPQHFQSLDALDRSGPGSLVVGGSRTRLSDREAVQAAFILAESGVSGFPPGIPVLTISDSRRALAALLHAFADRVEHTNPVIGEGTRIEPNATVMANVSIGRNCVIQPGAVIGCAGFGFFDGDENLEAMPHWAGVEIGDDCFIGANTVIAAGVLHPTVIGPGCNLDSHVQIAHNVRLGANGLIASQSGIAGSTVVGDGFRMGGASSVSGHLRLGHNVSVAARSGVTKDWPDGSIVAGFPARPIREWRRQQILRKKTEGN